MIVLQAQKVARVFGGNVLFDNISMEIQDRDRIALVGRNGAGKSTLLKIIAGIEAPDAGKIHKPKDITIGYIEQRTGLVSDLTVWEEMLRVFDDVIEIGEKMREAEIRLSDPGVIKDPEAYRRASGEYDQLQQEFMERNGYGYESEIKAVLAGFKFYEEDYHRPVEEFSGGQKTRLALARLLLEKRDLLILDEPTNHLDLETLTWLEKYLNNYQGALLMVSHDRYFLDKIVDQVYDLDHGNLYHYYGNYSDSLVEKAKRVEREWEAYEKQQQEIKRTEEFIEKNIVRASTTKQAQSRRKMLERMDRIDRPDYANKSAHFSFKPERVSGDMVLQVRDLTIGYEGQKISENIDLDLKKGEIIAIVGANGVGKSTLLKTLTGQIPKLGGDIRYGTKVDLGYYDQEQQDLTMTNTVLEELWSEHPSLDEQTIRSLLGSFLFSGDDVEKTVHSLSGGEKARLALAKLALDRDNTLILDEPTNHLDIDSKEVLENALEEFQGTVLFVSHDRYFINRLADKVLEIKEDESRLFLGDYDYYVEKSEEIDALQALEKTEGQEVQVEMITETEMDRQELKEYQKRIRKFERDLAAIEEKLASLEADLGDIQKQMMEPEIYGDPKLAAEYGAKEKDLQAQIEDQMNQWEDLALALEDLKN